MTANVTFTSWARLEPVTHDHTLAAGLHADIADPAWFLARQWQLGELQGDDAASPVTVTVKGAAGLTTRVQLGTATEEAYSTRTAPLDVLVKAEPAPDPARLSLTSAELSLMIIEELNDLTISGELSRRYKLPVFTAEQQAALDPATSAFFEAVSGIVFDGLAVVQAYIDKTFAALGATEDKKVSDAIETLRPHYDAVQSASSAWSSPTAGSSFSVGVASPGGGIELAVRHPIGAELGWWSFDRVGSSANAGQKFQNLGGEPLPATKIRIPGAPADRYWELEDGSIDLGAVAVAPSELAHLVVLEYLLVHGNDMIVVPLTIPYGSRAVISRVTVTDTFGDTVDVESAVTVSGGTFRMWEVSGDPGALYAPPVSMHTSLGPVLEEVVIARDEQANVGWMVEERGGDPAGTPTEFRRTVTTASTATGPAPVTPTTPREPLGSDSEVVWKWLLAPEVPETWHPLLPDGPAGGATRLVVGTTGTGRQIRMRTELGREVERTGLGLSAVPPEGIRLRRVAQVARWIDGSRHRWVARELLSGQGDLGSGMIFDAIEIQQR